MLATQLQICSMKRELPITASSSPGDAVRMELTAGTTTKYPALRIASVLIKPRIFLEGRVSGLFDRIWKVLVVLPKRQRLCMWVSIVCRMESKEWYRCTRFCWDIFQCGGKFRTSIFCRIRGMPSSNLHIGAWLNLLKRRWPIKLWTKTKCWR